MELCPVESTLTPESMLSQCTRHYRQQGKSEKGDTLKPASFGAGKILLS